MAGKARVLAALVPTTALEPARRPAGWHRPARPPAPSPPAAAWTARVQSVCAGRCACSALPPASSAERMTSRWPLPTSCSEASRVSPKSPTNQPRSPWVKPRRLRSPSAVLGRAGTGRPCRQVSRCLGCSGVLGPYRAPTYCTALHCTVPLPLQTCTAWTPSTTGGAWPWRRSWRRIQVGCRLAHVAPSFQILSSRMLRAAGLLHRAALHPGGPRSRAAGCAPAAR